MLALFMKLIKLPHSTSAFLEFTDHIRTTLGKGHFTGLCQSLFKGASAHSCTTVLLKSLMLFLCPLSFFGIIFKGFHCKTSHQIHF